MGGTTNALRIVHWLILAIITGVCVNLFLADQPAGQPAATFVLDFPALSILGNRPNMLASILDSGEQQLGIDLRSTWALTIRPAKRGTAACRLVLACMALHVPDGGRRRRGGVG